MLEHRKLFKKFRQDGYKYFIVPSKAKNKVYFTRANQVNNVFINHQVNKNLGIGPYKFKKPNIAPFKDTDEFDEFILDTDYEKLVFKVFPKNTYIKI